MRRFRNLLVNGGLLVASFGLALAVAEATVRVALPGGAPTGAGRGLYRHDELLGWEKRPNANVRLRSPEWDVTMSTNALGLRGEVVPAEAGLGPRVLLVGDSFIEAYTVRLEESVASVLEHKLRAAGLDGAQVLNGGTAGYSTDQEVLFYERDGSALRPDVVALFFYMNDLWYNTSSTYWRGAKPWFEFADDSLALRGVPVPGLAWASRASSDWLRIHSGLYRQVRQLLTSPRRDADGDTGAGPTAAAAPAEFLAWRRGADPELEGAWALTESLIARMRDRVQADGGEFILFYVPSKAALSAEVWSATVDVYGLDPSAWSATADRERLQGICERLSLECLDPLERFRREAAALGSLDALYFEIDGHWTPGGHELAASVLYERLAQALPAGDAGP